MTIFKSRQINLDPEPHVDAHGRRYARPFAGSDTCDGCTTHYCPRPELNVTRDERPWRDGSGVHWSLPVSSTTGRARTWAPRARFDNPVNPALVTFRHMHAGKENIAQAAQAWLLSLPTMRNLGVYTPTQTDHATRVLTRLANMEAS